MLFFFFLLLLQRRCAPTPDLHSLYPDMRTSHSRASQICCKAEFVSHPPLLLESVRSGRSSRQKRLIPKGRTFILSSVISAHFDELSFCFRPKFNHLIRIQRLSQLTSCCTPAGSIKMFSTSNYTSGNGRI